MPYLSAALLGGCFSPLHRIKERPSMTAETHSQLANFIWSICNLLRGPYKRNEYRKVILPLTVLRRFDCLLAQTKPAVLKEQAALRGRPESLVRGILERITVRPIYNQSKLDFPRLLDAPNDIAANLSAYIKAFSPNVREVMERFAFDQQIARMNEKNLLYEVVKAFARIDLSPERVDNTQMGYVFEELIRVGAEQSNEEAGEHFTPREVIKLMVNLLLSPEKDLARSHVVKTIFDPACGSRIAIIFNGSPLFTGDAGSGESEIRRWIIENDWLEAIVALPEQLFYNTGISTYLWVLTNRKVKERKRRIQLVDARNFWVQMEKSLGNKRRRIGDPDEKEKDPDHIAEITRIFGNFRDGETRAFKIDGQEKTLVVSKVFD